MTTTKTRDMAANLDPHHEQLIDIAVAAAPEATFKQIAKFRQLLDNIEDRIAVRNPSCTPADRQAA